MHIFESDYLYRLKVVGYVQRTKKVKNKNLNITSVFINSHNTIYELQYTIDYKTQEKTLQLITSPDISKLSSDLCGKANDSEISINFINKDDIFDYNLPDYIANIADEQTTSSRIILTEYFLLDIDGKFLLPLINKFTDCSFKILKTDLKKGV